MDTIIEPQVKKIKLLRHILIVKIVFTSVFWCFPLLIFPELWFTAMGPSSHEIVIVLRLLGIAYLALIVGYSFGLLEIKKNRNPIQTVWMGIVSNGFASVILLFYGFTGKWISWNIPGQLFMWLSALVTLCITILLIRYRLKLN